MNKNIRKIALTVKTVPDEYLKRPYGNMNSWVLFEQWILKLILLEVVLKKSKWIKFFFLYYSSLLLKAIFIAGVFQVYGSAKSDSVECRDIDTINFHQKLGLINVVTCFMDGITSVGDPSMIISTKNSSIHGIYMYRNKNIKFLPVKVDESFPHLKAYGANSLRLATISKENFQGLNELIVLYLQDNEIETIPIDVFEDLRSLKELSMGEFKVFENFSRKFGT